MVGKDKIILNCILFKNDVSLLKRTCEEYNISFCNIIRNIVHDYCDRIRKFSVSIPDTTPFNSHISLEEVLNE